uniref:Tc1-like transposase DDE domain-containing protein n=1 Tax=Graphocephala atropunctata TaxID=36148 RepID=A0A1B6KEA2_9HEMI
MSQVHRGQITQPKECVFPLPKGQRLIMIHAGSEAGFVPKAFTMWKASSVTGDYHDNVNKETMTKWMKEKLLPNIPPRSVIVVDNAPYPNVQKDKAPTSKSRKQVMQGLAFETRNTFSDDLLVPEQTKICPL